MSPAALSLLTISFEGKTRAKALGIYGSIGGAGGAAGVLLGGLLTSGPGWRWVLFVNVPIGILTALLARWVLTESTRQRGRFDLPGAITGTAGVALLVYGLSNASTDQAGVSHWGDAKVLVSLVSAAVLLAGFIAIELRSRHALMPLRLFADRSRAGAYLVMLSLATAMFGIFFFLTIFVQEVLGFSALRSGIAFLPFAGMIVVFSGIVSQVIGRIGARPLMTAGTLIAAGGMYWFSQITVHTTYVGGLLGPMLVTSLGFGLLFVPMSLVALNRVRAQDSGVASSLLNTGQQVGGAIGLAALGTVTWGVTATNIRHQVAQAAAAAARAGQHLPVAAHRGPVPAAVLHPALAAGISRGFEVSAGIAVFALLVVLATIRVRREDLAGAAMQPAVSDVHEAAHESAAHESAAHEAGIEPMLESAFD